MSSAPSYAPSLTPALRCARPLVPEGLLDALALVPDPRDPRGVRYRLATLLAIGVCAMTTCGHNSLAAIGEWVRRCDQQVLADLGCHKIRLMMYSDRKIPGLEGFGIDVVERIPIPPRAAGKGARTGNS